MHKKINKHVSGAIGVLLLTGVAVAIFAVWQYNYKGDAPIPSQPEPKPTRMFSFAGTDGWWQGATNQTSMALFQNDVHNCFVSAEYVPNDQVAAKTTKWQKAEDYLTKQGYGVSSIAAPQMSLQTANQPIAYKLTQQSVKTPAGQPIKLKGGQEFGYVQTTNGEVKLEGYCDTPEQLPATIPALNAIVLGEN